MAYLDSANGEERANYLGRAIIFKPHHPWARNFSSKNTPNTPIQGAVSPWWWKISAPSEIGHIMESSWFRPYCAKSLLTHPSLLSVKNFFWSSSKPRGSVKSILCCCLTSCIKWSKVFHLRFTHFPCLILENLSWLVGGLCLCAMKENIPGDLHGQIKNILKDLEPSFVLDCSRGSN